MFETYLFDAKKLFDLGIRSHNQKDQESAKMLYRASIMHSSSALEAYINYLAYSFSMSGNLPTIELAYLCDSAYYFDKGTKKTKVSYHPIDEKIRILIKIFNINFDFGMKEWSDFKEFKDFRNILIHPKQIDDDIDINIYKKKARVGISSVLNIMNILSKGVYKRPLRKKIAELAL